jgi:antitoxin (DNA-binding transcriptional repressor) of toxin-antitoxin stability system
MSAIDINDVQARIGEMLAAVERGETLAITRDGKAVALLEPAPEQQAPRLPSMTAFRAGLKVGNGCTGNSVVAMRDQERY